MRKLVTLVLAGLLMALALPAGAAKPISNYLVTWSVDGGTVTLDTETNIVTLDVDSTTWVTCGGASAIADVVWKGSAVAEVTVDKQARSGSFSVVSDQLTISTVSACGGTSTTSMSGSFEIDRGRADLRTRDGSNRIIERSGVGSLTVGSLVLEAIEVSVQTTITR